MRVVVFGNSGSGKSTYAKALVTRDAVACLDLDTLVWKTGEIAVLQPAADVEASLQSFIATHAGWIIEGCYGDLIGTAAKHCDELVFLNPGRETCLSNNRQRPWEPHKYASTAAQDAMLEYLQAWVAGYYLRADDCSYQRHREIFDGHPGPKREIRHLPDRSASPGSSGP